MEYLTAKERSTLTSVLGHLVVYDHKYKTTLTELNSILEKKNHLTIDNINNILLWVKNATTDELYSMVLIYQKTQERQKKYRERSKG